MMVKGFLSVSPLKPGLERFKNNNNNNRTATFPNYNLQTIVAKCSKPCIQLRKHIKSGHI